MNLKVKINIIPFNQSKVYIPKGIQEDIRIKIPIDKTAQLEDIHKDFSFKAGPIYTPPEPHA